ncbi:MAG: Excinuclease ABC family protein [Candidatus Jorgensenbacteria bacterium GW2011_GWB1_49_9]|uniref:UvrABC system protein A n=1 Tax=Candidatus Vogelbacteria bacterium GWA1_51_14 TaxID=1802435 RepID=A0A1G2Q9Z3_9BACT|nr:MAG: Excinuclease ABC family protein [Candidatus Jorgensenbacteria bacterium GW2011_GWB1_49_9]OHA56782.1 MAG: excinuclease ABC subunit A [Candidatus Vogelbacteria bacterium GWA1_51_14]
MSEKKDDKIIIKGARTHNLKNIDLEIPRDKLVVFTGLSGSGKSSLAFDTIFAEGQRRYVESLSAYARQFLRQMQKPDVDEITGLSPAISIDQKSRSQNPRSTVATITEIYDYLRVLYARVGRPYCLVCGEEIKRLSPEEIVNFALEKIGTVKDKAETVRIYAPVVRGRKGEYYQLLYDLLDKGFNEVLIDGKRYKLRERIILTKTKKHDISVLMDELAVSDFAQAVSALGRSAPGGKKQEKKSEVKKAVIKSLADGARERLSEAVERSLKEAGGLVEIKLDDISTLLSAKFSCPNDGFSYPEIEPRLFSFNSPYGACPECHGLGTEHLFSHDPCPACHGARLRPEALQVKLGSGHSAKNLVEVSALSVADASSFFQELKLTNKEEQIAELVLREIKSRLKFLLDVGLDYLALDRRANTLSGGEAQRIRLASQLGSRLVGTLYVLDEPTIGLHARDNNRLIKTLTNLRDLGNTIIVVEHDEDTIFASDFLVDIGPGAGVHGGKIVVADETDKLITAKTDKSGSLTVAYLRGDETILLPEKRRTADKGHLKIRGGKIFNLKNLNVDLPLGRLVTVTGVSGSGKSSFLYEILHKNLLAKLERRQRSNQVFNANEFSGTEPLSRVILIDQSPIGRTPRSNPATYTGAWAFIRELFATSELARIRGWKPGRFSFNVKGGRCEACQGNGQVAVEMHFLPTVYVTCDVCEGKRFQKETLEVEYRGKNIDDILHMTIEEALQFFGDIPAVYDRLRSLMDVGLGYLELGQSATTLSGGEAQRVKISSELYRPDTRRTIYLLDEPTVGLHYEDVKNLIAILQKLVEKGNSVVIIEHNLEIIKSADYVIDLGPDGGEGGGRLVAAGTPEEVAANSDSHTAFYLRKLFRKQKK